MRKTQLKARLEQLLHKSVHFKTVTFSYRIDQGDAHKANNYTNIYISRNGHDVQNIGWVSENIRGTAYVRNVLGISDIKGDAQSRERLWDEVQNVILQYSNTSIDDRHPKFIVAMGKGRDGLVAVYSKDDMCVTKVPQRLVPRLKSIRFTDNQFSHLLDHLPTTFRKIAEDGKMPLSDVEKSVENEY